MFLFDSTDSLLSKFTSLVDRLTKVAEKHDYFNQLHTKLAAEYKAKAGVAQKEAQRARAIAQKIEDLITI